MPAQEVALSDKWFRCLKAGADIPLVRPRCARPTDYCTSRGACPVHLLEQESKRPG